MGQTTAGLLEIEPFVQWPDGGFGARYCELCGDDAFGERPWRTFYYDPEEGLSICEHCVEGYLREGAEAEAKPHA